MPWLVSRDSETAEDSAGAVKEGQPQWESNFVSDWKRISPQPAHRYTPGVFVSQYSPVNARSVPFSRRIRYCSGVRRARHSASLKTTFSDWLSDFDSGIGLPFGRAPSRHAARAATATASQARTRLFTTGRA